MRGTTVAFGVALAVLGLAVPPSARAADQAATTLAPVLAATDWLNGRPSADALRGKVVLVDVFTFDCYNCKNVTPNLRKLHADDPGKVAVVGVHAPETPFEHGRSHVVDALRAQGITWPVALDNTFAVWHAYGIEAWPTQLIFDKKGRLRKTVVGDSQDDLVDETVRTLLAER
jgi:thiol-disulfide isomerase/thioredoxin